MGSTLAVLAAFAFAFGTVLQQKGTLTTTQESGDAPWLIQILRKPVWLAGMVMQASGWILQAVALDKAPLMVVQAITSLSLVIALPIGIWLTGQQVDRKVVAGAVAVVAGIVVFLSVGSPHGGTTNPNAATWWTACLVIAALVLVFVALGRSRQGATRALLFGSAAGFGYGLQTAVTKDFDLEVGHGLVALLADWSIYVLAASAVVGFILQQSALKTGVLAPAMASSNAVTLFVGVVLGSVIFGEMLGNGSGHVAPAIVGLLLAVAGVVLLARAEGPTADPAQGEHVPFQSPAS